MNTFLSYKRIHIGNSERKENIFGASAMKSVHQSHHAFECYQVTGKKTLQYYIRSIQYFDKEDVHSSWWTQVKYAQFSRQK